MFKSLDTVPEEYFYQFLAARDTAKRARIKGLWASMIFSGVFLLFSSIFVHNTRPRVEYSYYCNLIFAILFGDDWISSAPVRALSPDIICNIRRTCTKFVHTEACC